MKIELNPNRMTIPELTDCINELIAQRDRLLEEEREAAEVHCHNAFISAFGKIWDYTETGNFNVALEIKTVNGRRHHIPLNMEQIEEWHLEVTRTKSE